MNTTTDVGLATLEMTVKDFSNIMRRNGFTDSHSTVRHVNGDFEVITKHVMNIGNLMDIEKKWGLIIHLIDPKPDGNVRVVFGNIQERSIR